MTEYVAEQENVTSAYSTFQEQILTTLPVNTVRQPCYLDSDELLAPPIISTFRGLPQGMPAPLFGSHRELGLRDDICYDRINRFAPYGLGRRTTEGGLGIGLEGDTEGVSATEIVDWTKVNLTDAQDRCQKKNSHHQRRTAFVIRTWHTYEYTAYHVMMLRAIISELSLASGGEFTVHFLIHVQDDNLPIWASEEVYNSVLSESLPPEFQGMGTLWSVAQMRLIYPPPFPDSIVNFSGGDIYGAYRSMHFPMQYFASKHPEFDYFWQWEMDMRVTGHYLELLEGITQWAESQKVDDYLWERSSKYFISSLFNGSYSEFAAAVREETSSPIARPQLKGENLPNPLQTDISDHVITDFISLNPMFDPEHTRWAFSNDITGFGDTRPPTRAALITTSRMSRRLLLLMHEETYRNKRTMFPEMFPASLALQYGLKAVSVPHPVYFDRDWAAKHADVIFNNAKLDDVSKAIGMGRGGDYYHDEGGSVFGPGEHVFKGSTYYSNAGFAGELWRRWLGIEDEQRDHALEIGEGGGRMCLPMMLLHPIKERG
ncbi:hypothetical protein UCRPC4_g05118 [Phaeomoniella chlamydospora]|uniref:Major facilitator superfamily transporter n=1 Tax=Phaeomoniella chlamydospora TaxID=158046 RepID=A0A0G2G2Q9_PHACM|nr:hypothetical protein UCRPC4_g05118 [Phaeomoniella chlamydospora]